MRKLLMLMVLVLICGCATNRHMEARLSFLERDIRANRKAIAELIVVVNDNAEIEKRAIDRVNDLICKHNILSVAVVKFLEKIRDGWNVAATAKQTLEWAKAQLLKLVGEEK